MRVLTMTWRCHGVHESPSQLAARPRMAQCRLTPSVSGEVIGSRYRLGELLGEGSSGAVFAATDAVTGGEVAVKLVVSQTASQRRRLRREVASLRFLRLPGVVRLMDVVEAGDALGLVMDRVQGAPFAGRAAATPWDALAPTLTQLLDTLARIHRAGMVHGDLKPANVLVLPTGRPIVLDFGLARGVAVETEVTQSGGIAGTLAFMAPECLLGAPPTVQSDLYAVGVMAYEALCGVPPWSDPLHRLTQAPTATLPDLPPGISELLDSMVAVRPDQRPTSAQACAEGLGHHRAPWSPAHVPAPAFWDDLMGGCAEPGVTRVGGPRGAGATHWLRRARSALEQAGTPVHWLDADSGPLGTVRSLIPDDLPASASVADVAEAIRRRVQGTVVLVDRLHQADVPSRRMLDALPGACIVATVGDGTHTLCLPQTDPTALQRWFVGSDRLVHHARDASIQVHDRSGGWVGCAVRDVRALIRAGIVGRHAGGLLVTRSQLTAMRAQPLWTPSAPTPPTDDPASRVLAAVHLAWPEASRVQVTTASGDPRWQAEAAVEMLLSSGSLAEESGRLRPHAPMPEQSEAWIATACEHLSAGLPRAHPGRWRLHLRAGRMTQAIDAALDWAEPRLSSGSGAAVAPVFDVLLGGCPLDLEAGRPYRALLRGLSRAALVTATADDLSRAQAHHGRAPEDLAPGWEAVLVARHRRLAGDVAGAVRGLDAVPTARLEQDAALHRWWWILRNECTKEDPTRHARFLDEAERRAPLAMAPELAGWRGLAEYRRGQFRDSAKHHLASMEGAHGVRRLSATLNAAAATLEVPDLQTTGRLAEQARDLAQRLRLPRWEARAELLLRSARYRAGDAMTADTSLVEAASRLEIRSLCALITLQEAAVAWRAGADVEAWAGRLDTQTAGAPRAVRWLAEALTAVWRGTHRAVPPSEMDGLPPGVVVQVLSADAPTPAVRARARSAADLLVQDRTGHRREVWSVDECLRRLEA